MRVRVFRRQALPVDFARGQLAGTPLCMEQYHRLFTSYRYPGRKTDTLKVQPNEASAAPQHVIVACKNQVSAQAGHQRNQRECKDFNSHQVVVRAEKCILCCCFFFWSVRQTDMKILQIVTSKVILQHIQPFSST